MKLVEPQIKRAICQIDYDRNLRLFSQMGNLGHALCKTFGFGEFGTSPDNTRLSLKNTEEKLWTHVESARTGFIMNDPGVFTNFKSKAEQVLKKVQRDLQIETLKRIGVRLMYLSTVDGCSFEELNSILLECLCNARAISSMELKEHPPSDMGLTLDYDVGERRGHLRIGPLRKQEVIQQCEEEEENAPELSVLVDVDYYANAIDKPLEWSLVRDMLGEANDHSLGLCQRVLDVIRETANG